MTQLFNFYKKIVRRGSNSYKWDSSEREVLPLWVADMDFEVAPAIKEALLHRVNHGIFGYTITPDKYYQAISAWQLQRNQLHLQKQQILPVIGVLPALTATMSALGLKGQQVIIQTPVYNHFFTCIRNSGLEAVSNPLKYEHGHYAIDFDDLEHKASSARARFLLLCNPHNPTGRLWTQQELEQIAQLAIKHNLVIISDEIHADIRPTDSNFISMGLLQQKYPALHLIICSSASKAFNLAGLQNAYIISFDPQLLMQIDRQVNIHEVQDLNPFGIVATIAAYQQGQEWLDAMNAYIDDNFKFFKHFFSQQLPQLTITDLQATYLGWFEIKATGLSSEEIYHKLLDEAQVWLAPGSDFGNEGEGFMRINLACTRNTLEQALEKTAQVLKPLLN